MLSGTNEPDKPTECVPTWHCAVQSTDSGHVLRRKGEGRGGPEDFRTKERATIMALCISGSRERVRFGEEGVGPYDYRGVRDGPESKAARSREVAWESAASMSAMKAPGCGGDGEKRERRLGGLFLTHPNHVRCPGRPPPGPTGPGWAEETFRAHLGSLDRIHLPRPRCDAVRVRARVQNTVRGTNWVYPPPPTSPPLSLSRGQG